MRLFKRFKYCFNHATDAKTVIHETDNVFFNDASNVATENNPARIFRYNFLLVARSMKSIPIHFENAKRNIFLKKRYQIGKTLKFVPKNSKIVKNKKLLYKYDFFLIILFNFIKMVLKS